MSVKKRDRKNSRWKIVLVVILVPLLFGAGYAFSAGNAGEKLRQWFGREEITAPPDGESETETPEETSGEPVEPEPKQEKPDQPDQSGDPVKDKDKPETPIIYTGQSLTIPGDGGDSSATASTVITKGTVSSGKKQIALTFDSGWEYTHCKPLLNILDEHKIKATFFPRADWVATHPELARDIISRGHTMGNHSKTHPDMTKDKLSAAKIHQEMRQSTEIIEEICGVRPYLFRPPYGAYDEQLLKILAEEGYPYTIMWSIDTIDWDAGNVRKVGGKDTLVDEDFIVNRVLQNSEQNKTDGIVLMHIGGDTAGHLTVPALPRIIEGLREQGYSFTTVDKMLPPSGQLTHTVQKGETLYSIARRYGITVQQLIEANNL